MNEDDYSILLIRFKNTFKEKPQIYKDIIKCIYLFTSGIISMSEFEEVVETAFKELDAMKECERLLKILRSRCKGRKQLTWYCKSLAELTQAKCKRMGSYLCLPEDYPSLVSTGRLSSLASELNNMWISVASGSEDNSFKVTRKNIYEEQLCKCEDERFEHDMAINCCDYAIKELEKVLEEIPNNSDR
jgi:paired amphipathic helix protein Sin3a